MDQPALSLSEQRQLRGYRAELNASRARPVLDCLEHARERRVSFGSMAARLEARRRFGAEFLRNVSQVPGTEQRDWQPAPADDARGCRRGRVAAARARRGVTRGPPRRAAGRQGG